jgi:hypothetical protein
MWEEAKVSIVSVELYKMTKFFGLLVKILGGVDCLKHLVGGQQLHIDHKPETTSLEKVEFGVSGYSIGAVIRNWQILVGMSRIWLDTYGHKVMDVIQFHMMV